MSVKTPLYGWILKNRFYIMIEEKTEGKVSEQNWLETAH
jgi:hypothetical protein